MLYSLVDNQQHCLQTTPFHLYIQYKISFHHMFHIIQDITDIISFNSERGHHSITYKFINLNKLCIHFHNSHIHSQQDQNLLCIKSMLIHQRLYHMIHNFQYTFSKHYLSRSFLQCTDSMLKYHLNHKFSREHLNKDNKCHFN